MSPDDVIQLSRMQFAITALFHFIFVPLTHGAIVYFSHHGICLRDDGQAHIQRYGEILG